MDSKKEKQTPLTDAASIGLATAIAVSALGGDNALAGTIGLFSAVWLGLLVSRANKPNPTWDRSRTL